MADNFTYGFNRDDHDALINSIESGESPGFQGDERDITAFIIMTPSGGIPARSGTTIGKANCVIYRINSSDVLESTSTEIEVVNLAASAVAGSVYAQAKRAAGRWVCDYEEC